MHRLIARILLILVLVGTFVPLGLAISMPALHACCMRKPMPQAGPQFSAALDCCNHDCCRSLVTPRWARPAQNIRAYTSLGYSRFSQQFIADRAGAGTCDLHSGRSPPDFSIA